MGRTSAEARRTIVARLEHLRAEKALSSRHVDVAAQALGVSPRTVWRWLAVGAAPAPDGRRRRSRPRPAYALTSADREAYAYYRGNVSAVHRAREAVLVGDGTTAGAPVPDFLAEGWAGARSVTCRTLTRAFAAEMTPAERAAWRVGEAGRRGSTVYLSRPDAPRGRCWEMDHKQLPMLVLPPKGAAVSPWLTAVVDDGTRALLGWAISLYPHAGTVLTAMRMALVHEPAVSPFGAVPERVRIDRGLEFAAASVTEALGNLAVVVHRLPAFTPHRKGKVERLNRTIEQTLLSGLPGFTGGPRDASGRLYGPIGDSPAARAAAGQEGGPMRIEHFAERFKAWVHWYNHERPHRALDGRTPLAAWNEDPAAVHRVPAEHLRNLLLAGVERTVGKSGIRFAGLSYLAPELHGLGGRIVQVRHMPHDDRWIEVYLDGAHLCTAHPTGHLTPEQTEAFREHARAEAARLGLERRRASRRARRELAPMTDGTNAQPSRLVAAAEAGERTERAREAALRRLARSDLLGLVDPCKEP